MKIELVLGRACLFVQRSKDIFALFAHIVTSCHLPAVCDNLNSVSVVSRVLTRQMYLIQSVVHKPYGVQFLKKETGFLLPERTST